MQEDNEFKACQGNLVESCLTKRLGIYSVVECLPGPCEALGDLRHHKKHRIQ